ncbi:hypothetical protein E4U42_001134 [Claviceps africana]|uniref:Uncharacterized protein n=1 Tax=Claviceps africana TaxID=83212 RepID=A0A8K0JFN1_9HYPO|nr:hypothetical protein E4U42_001134 [Claviceps africana]
MSSISLPTLSIKSKSDDTILTSKGELDIRLPGSCGIIETALELEQVAGKAKVWIAKKGLCHFVVDFFINGIPISDAETLHHLETVIMRCDIWKRLELGLVPVTEPRGERTNRVTYSIQHPDLSSALAPPDTAPVACFRSVLYSIDVLTSQRRTIATLDSEGAQRRSHGKKIKLCNDEKTARITWSGDENEEYKSLAYADRNAVDDFLGKLKTNFETYPPSSVPKKRGKTEDIRTDAACSPHVRVLLSTWLDCVFLGARPCCKTVVLTPNMASAPLSQMAPGVFDVPYLKLIFVVERICETRIYLSHFNVSCPYEQCRVSYSAQESGTSWYNDPRPG